MANEHKKEATKVIKLLWLLHLGYLLLAAY